MQQVFRFVYLFISLSMWHSIFKTSLKEYEHWWKAFRNPQTNIVWKQVAKGSKKHTLKFYKHSIDTYKALMGLGSSLSVLYHITKKLKRKEPVWTPSAHAGNYCLSEWFSEDLQPQFYLEFMCFLYILLLCIPKILSFHF